MWDESIPQGLGSSLLRKLGFIALICLGLVPPEGDSTGERTAFLVRDLTWSGVWPPWQIADRGAPIRGRLLAVSSSCLWRAFRLL